jgi:hypothetical protein
LITELHVFSFAADTKKKCKGCVKPSRVENRRCVFSLPVVVGSTFVAPPQSGLTCLCFLFPLIEPDWQFSRIRLSEKIVTLSPTDRLRFALGD